MHRLIIICIILINIKRIKSEKTISDNALVYSQQSYGEDIKVYAVVGSQLELYCSRSEYFGICGWKSEDDVKFCNVLSSPKQTNSAGLLESRFCPTDERLEIKSGDGYKCRLWIHGVDIKDTGLWTCSTRYDPMDIKPPIFTNFSLEVISPYQLELVSDNVTYDPAGGWQEHVLTCRAEGQGAVIPQVIWSTDNPKVVLLSENTTRLSYNESLTILESTTRINLTESNGKMLEVRCLQRQIHPSKGEVVFESSKSLTLTREVLKTDTLMMTNAIIIPICIILALVVIIGLFIRQKSDSCNGTGTYGTYKTTETQNLVDKQPFKKTLFLTNLGKKSKKSDTGPKKIEGDNKSSRSKVESLNQPVIILPSQITVENQKTSNIESIDTVDETDLDKSTKTDLSTVVPGSGNSTLSRSSSLKRKHLVTITQGTGEYVRLVKINTPSNSPMIHSKQQYPQQKSPLLHNHRQQHSPYINTPQHSPLFNTQLQHSHQQHSPLCNSQQQHSPSINSQQHHSPLLNTYNLSSSASEQQSAMINLHKHTQQVNIEQYNPDVNTEQNQQKININQDNHANTGSAHLSQNEISEDQNNSIVNEENEQFINAKDTKEKIETDF